MNKNPSVVPQTAVGPSGVVIVDSLPEQEICLGCGMRIPDECLGCHLYTASGGEERKKKKKYRGVSLRASGNWAVEIMVPGKERKWLGTFKTAEEFLEWHDLEDNGLNGWKEQHYSYGHRLIW
ncbi:hypothetical protein L1987_66081 [Smallanthus sonchifolius]|uniref:Uncharacterized protein n=1 Tax=Smallanthus sonchifolius TaxID=185202 RepID=A0ACB9BWB6_9ASTR|nr:hypothetical protein L1987_66081 [Smallanthus sonchifolius]